MTQQNTVIEYPTGLSSIPFASFLQIEKYSYDEAQKTVAKEFNDALGSFNRSKISDLVRTGSNALAVAYGSGEPGKTTVNDIDTYRTEDRQVTEKTGFFGRKTRTKTVKGDKININQEGIDPNIVVQLADGTKKTVGQLLKEKQDKINRKNKGLMSSLCNLPLPNEFQYKYGADWSNEFKLGTLALAADEAGKFAGVATAGGIIGGGLDFLGQKLT